MAQRARWRSWLGVRSDAEGGRLPSARGPSGSTTAQVFPERYPHLGPIAPGEIVVALPLLLSDRLLGIAAFVLAPGAGAREERALMESLADHTAQALDRAGPTRGNSRRVRRSLRRCVASGTR